MIKQWRQSEIDRILFFSSFHRISYTNILMQGIRSNLSSCNPPQTRNLKIQNLHFTKFTGPIYVLKKNKFWVVNFKILNERKGNLDLVPWKLLIIHEGTLGLLSEIESNTYSWNLLKCIESFIHGPSCLKMMYWEY